MKSSQSVPNVTTFKEGDRVIGFTAGFTTKKDTDNAFQTYTVLDTSTISKIPDSISFENGVVLPLSVSTAASGLFNPDFLNLRLPTEPAQEPASETLLVWGGASSVGSSVIQLAVAAGYEVTNDRLAEELHVREETWREPRLRLFEQGHRLRAS